MTNANWTNFCAEKYTKTINWALVVGLLISNLILVIFLIALAAANDPSPIDGVTENKFFIHMEIASWSLGIFSAFTLISSTLYTSWVLRNLYGTDFRNTSFQILAIATIFILSFSSRSTYEWIMFYYYRK